MKTHYPGKSPPSHSHLVRDKGTRNIHRRKDSPRRENSKTIGKMLGPISPSAHNKTLNESGLNARPDTLEPVKENTWKHFRISQNRALIAQEIIAKVDKYSCIRS